MIRYLILFCFIANFALLALAETEPTVDFGQVRSILSNNCFACHGPDKAERQGDLRLDVAESDGDQRGAHSVIMAGNSADSELFQRITSADPDLRMPPVESAKSLTSEEIEVLRAWIELGATYQQHWSYRAKLTDAQHDPLTLESVSATLVNPDGSRIPIEMEKFIDGTRQGIYVHQLIASQEGDYRVELQLPGSDDLLIREIRVRVPQLEIENPRRNDALLALIAEQTSGHYFVGVPATTKLGNNNQQALNQKIAARDQETELPGTPDRDFEERLMGWLIALISGVLCFEWIIRRLSKLA